MKHSELLSQLENCKNNFILTLAGLAAVSDRRSAQLLNSMNCSFGGFTIEFSQVVTMFSGPADRQIAAREAVLSVFRALLKESFEIVKNYAENSGQGEAFQKFPSYKYHRLVRHALSHDFRWDLITSKGKPYEYLPLAPWHPSLLGHVATLDASMHNQDMKLEQLPFDAMWLLFRDLVDEAHKSLS